MFQIQTSNIEKDAYLTKSQVAKLRLSAGEQYRIPKIEVNNYIYIYICLYIKSIRRTLAHLKYESQVIFSSI